MSPDPLLEEFVRDLMRDNRDWFQRKSDQEETWIQKHKDYSDIYVSVCSDSRVVSFLFSGLHIDVAQIAGNHVPEIPKGKRYGINIGHTNCGAVAARKAVDEEKLKSEKSINVVLNNLGIGSESSLGHLVKKLHQREEDNAIKQAKIQLRNNSDLEAVAAMIYDIGNGELRVIGYAERGVGPAISFKKIKDNERVKELIQGSGHSLMFIAMSDMLDNNYRFNMDYFDGKIIRRGQSPYIIEYNVLDNTLSLQEITGRNGMEYIGTVFSVTAPGEKNHHSILGSLTYALNHFKDATLVIVGDEPEDIQNASQYLIENNDPKGLNDSLYQFIKGGGKVIGTTVNVADPNLSEYGVFELSYKIHFDFDKPETHLTPYMDVKGELIRS